MKEVGIYVHIPFCKHKCYYCDFISFADKNSLIDEYIKKYNKSQKFIDTLNIKIVTSIDKYMYNYFFHKDNYKSKKECRYTKNS